MIFCRNSGSLITLNTRKMEVKYSYSEAKEEEIVDFNKELSELSDKHSKVLCPVPYINEKGSIEAVIKIFNKVELIPKGEGVPSPYNGNVNGENNNESTENTPETPETDA